MDNNSDKADLHCAVGGSRLYWDARLGGITWYVFTDDPRSLMLIPDEVRKCVVFVGYRDADGVPRFAGTAFFVVRSSTVAPGIGFVSIVTAKHVIDKIRDKNATVLIRVNFRTGGARWIDTVTDGWLAHPDEPEAVDVAVYPTQFDQN